MINVILKCNQLTNTSAIQRERLNKLEMEFNGEQDIIIAEFDTEREMLIRQNTSELTDLQVFVDIFLR